MFTSQTWWLGADLFCEKALVHWMMTPSQCRSATVCTPQSELRHELGSITETWFTLALHLCLVFKQPHKMLYLQLPPRTANPNPK